MINVDDELQEILIQAGLSVEQRSKVVKIAKELEAAKKEEKEEGAVDKKKNKFTIFLRGDKDLAEKVAAGWIVKSPQDVDDNEASERLIRAARYQNDASKRKKNPIRTWFDLFRHLKSKHTKTIETNVSVTTKEAVRVIVLEDENAL